jgi:hypothetical protein
VNALSAIPESTSAAAAANDDAPFALLCSGAPVNDGAWPMLACCAAAGSSQVACRASLPDESLADATSVRVAAADTAPGTSNKASITNKAP